ncbi:MAG: RNA-guided pseudouridylation complex pseudouridine synthase subunit Cbf5 [Candidatus Pacearchaeota archaeon]|jgi:H/ACA ribonucleoprotein complex subunit 4
MEKTIEELLNFSIINIDKPSGPTSHKVVSNIRRILRIKKAGHFGTLDPKVTGVLPIALGRACRLSGYFMKKDKEYLGKMYLHKDIDINTLKKEMNEFIGKINQKPPRKSSVKRVNRIREVEEFKILKKEDKIVSFQAKVEAGTYIRKLISDLGDKIGGAHMIELRRIRAGLFIETKSFRPEEVESAYNKYLKGNDKELRNMLIPAEIVQDLFPKINVKEEFLKEFLNGRPIYKKDIIGKYQIYDKMSVLCGERFIEIAKSVDEGEIIAVPEFVLN